MRRPRRSSHIGERVAAGAVMVAVPAVVFWTRQTSSALLQVESFGGAASQVAFWSAPTVMVLFLLRGRQTVVIGGLAATTALSAVWWGSARDSHSTASLRPGLTGWLVLPVVLLLLRLAEGRIGRRRVVRSPG